jgi:DNA mismatch endonuclease (patch repair protein)
MRGNRGRDTRPELALRSELHRRGFRFRAHFRPVDEFPYVVDIAFPRQRVAVAVDGCIWHGCPEHGMRPRRNTEYWRLKIASNIARDERTDQALAHVGWMVVRVWEHEPVPEAVDRIGRIISSRGSP